MLEGSILQQLEAAHQDSKRPLNFGVYYKNTLVALCHALEDFILKSNSSPLMIAAFQRGKWYLQEADRYGEIAEKTAHVAIMAAAESGFAEHPTSQRENVDLVSLDPADPVAQEWHLIVFSPTYTAMVLCQELSDADYGMDGVPSEDIKRKFYGFWTFEPDLVQETVEIAIAHIGRYNPELQQSLTAQMQQLTAKVGTQPRDDLGVVVHQVVDYLQDSQQSLADPQGTNAEASAIYERALGDNLVSNEVQAFLRMAQLMDQANTENSLSAAEVATMAETMGQLLDLPAWQLKRLRLAALMHALVPSMRSEIPSEPEESTEEMAPYCQLLPSVQALRAMPQMTAIAQIITHQTEWWDGSGTPGAFAYDAIPLESRILALVADFQRRVNQIRKAKQSLSREEALSQALAECQSKSGQAFDPKLVDTLALMAMGMQQGMDLQTNQPKIAAGMWLLDSHPHEEAQLNAVTKKT